jgi:hypothetical protein
VGIKILKNIEGEIKQINELKRCINKWPAVMLATSRTDKVIGRIRLLTISINTIIGIRSVGEPIGTMWVSKLFVFLHKK